MQLYWKVGAQTIVIAPSKGPAPEETIVVDGMLPNQKQDLCRAAAVHSAILLGSSGKSTNQHGQVLLREQADCLVSTIGVPVTLFRANGPRDSS